MTDPILIEAPLKTDADYEAALTAIYCRAHERAEYSAGCPSSPIIVKMKAHVFPQDCFIGWAGKRLDV